jgi:hypothetical protein
MFELISAKFLSRENVSLVSLILVTVVIIIFLSINHIVELLFLLMTVSTLATVFLFPSKAGRLFLSAISKLLKTVFIHNYNISPKLYKSSFNPLRTVCIYVPYITNSILRNPNLSFDWIGRWVFAFLYFG